MNDVIIQTIKDLGLTVELLILFGSRANNKEHADSDYDLGILLNQPLDFSWMVKLKTELSDKLAQDVDIIDLRSADPIISMQIVSTGIPLIEREPGVFPCFRADTWSRYIDFKQSRKPLEDAILEKAKRVK